MWTIVAADKIWNLKCKFTHEFGINESLEVLSLELSEIGLVKSWYAEVGCVTFSFKIKIRAPSDALLPESELVIGAEPQIQLVKSSHVGEISIESSSGIKNRQ